MARRRKGKLIVPKPVDASPVATVDQQTDEVLDTQTEGRQLLLCHPAGTRLISLLPGNDFVIGRSAPADVVVPEPAISREHVRVVVSRDEVTIIDLGSTNGIHRGRERIVEAALRPGEEVLLGRDVVLQLIHGYSPEGGGLTSYEQFEVLLKQEALRARQSRSSIALLMVSRPPGKNAPVTALAAKLRSLVGPLDRIAAYSSDVLQVLVVGRGDDQYADLARRFVSATHESKLFVGMATSYDSPASVHGLVDVALARLREATAETPFVHGGGSREAAIPIIAQDAQMRELLSVVEKVAPARLHVLIVGETGAGKEVLARELHRRGPRTSGPFHALNCGAIPAQLAESMLFGHVKGAFTGAVQDRAGIFEQANGGTVFLDEIGELPLELQAKLLRVLETSTVKRVGSHEEVTTDARVISATHRDLDEMCAEGAFRQDLFFRLNGIALALPPLRNRKDDIEPLARAFLERAVVDNATQERVLGAAALQCLELYHWPGNVRELKNVMERAAVIARDRVIGPHDLPTAIAQANAKVGDAMSAQHRQNSSSIPTDPTPPPAQINLDEQVASFESDLLLAALTKSSGNKSRAAAELDMPRRSFLNKLDSHGVVERFEAGEATRDDVAIKVGSQSFKAATADFESALLRDALAVASGNKAAAARLLGVPAHVVQYKAKKYGLDPES